MNRRNFLGTGSLGLAAATSLTIGAASAATAKQETIMQDLTQLPKLSLLSRDTAAVLFIDHQIGLLTGGQINELNAVYAVLRDNRFDLTKLAEGSEQIAEFQAAHVSQPGYCGSITVVLGNGRHLSITLWQAEPSAEAVRTALEPVVKRLLVPLMAAPSKLVSVGEVLFNDITSS